MLAFEISKEDQFLPNIGYLKNSLWLSMIPIHLLYFIDPVSMLTQLGESKADQIDKSLPPIL